MFFLQGYSQVRRAQGADIFAAKFFPGSQCLVDGHCGDAADRSPNG